MVLAHRHARGITVDRSGRGKDKMAHVARDRSLEITPDLRLTRRFTPSDKGDAVDRVRVLLSELSPLTNIPTE